MFLQFACKVTKKIINLQGIYSIFVEIQTLTMSLVYSYIHQEKHRFYISCHSIRGNGNVGIVPTSFP